MVTTYQVNSDDLDYNIVNLIKKSFPSEDIIIDVYQSENIKFEIDEISNQKIIKRIEDIKSNQNLIFSI